MDSQRHRFKWLVSRLLKNAIDLKKQLNKRLNKRSISLLLSGYFLAALWLSVLVVPSIARVPIPPGEAIAQPSSDPDAQLARGQQHYQAGQYADAIDLWEQALQAYRDRNQIDRQVQTLTYLSLAYQHLGQWQQAENAIETSLDRLQGFPELDANGETLRGQALNALGQLQLTRGQTEDALESWQQAEAAYARADDETGRLTSQINQAGAMQALGQYRQARAQLDRTLEILQNQADTSLKASGLRSLGTVLQTIGDLERAKTVLEESWRISDRLNDRANTSATLFGIGNIAHDLQQYDTARSYYQEAARLTPDPLLRVQAYLNQLSLWIDWCRVSGIVCPADYVDISIEQIQTEIATLPPSRAAVYASVNLADSWMALDPQAEMRLEISQELATAIDRARQLGDRRAQAYALTQLGKLYERSEQWEDAQTVTQQALQLVRDSDADDIIARASWQLGRILKREGKLDRAKAAYESAYESLQALRSDLLAVNSDVQFEFKESVEPVYREFVSLLLGPGASQEDLQQAREAIEALQLAELDNFFGDACLETQPVAIEEIDPHAAVIYPIILADRLEVILSMPGRPLRHYATALPASQVEATLQKFYSSLYVGYNRLDRSQLSERVYDWLVRPAEADLSNSEIQTLVFVLDGWLRNLPMAALFDGERYLIEKYSLALSPGLQLFPQGLKREQLAILAAGLTEPRQGFSPLPGVEGEVERITMQLESHVLLDRAFTRESFQREIDETPFSIVHLATHGQFSSNPDDTFLLTWDDRIRVKDFDLLFQARQLGIVSPIDLLVMSACQTATGDSRATLGLAGFALRSGANSTLASLFPVSDRATAELMSEFYRQLTQVDRPITKAEALRQAQLKLLNDRIHAHPYFWSTFVLVGNWL
ncbi:MAG: CHAT domain-containing protein [Cyanobacteria bacterium SID2]|nr:CHAT domain-containing protein [Cyanobacteria bacterium SID2]MBP0006569.1 CHAT domain-containing protein [Cyanobacteria bacterium SBC]